MRFWLRGERLASAPRSLLLSDLRGKVELLLPREKFTVTRECPAHLLLLLPYSGRAFASKRENLLTHNHIGKDPCHLLRCLRAKPGTSTPAPIPDDISPAVCSSCLKEPGCRCPAPLFSATVLAFSLHFNPAPCACWDIPPTPCLQLLLHLLSF